MRRLHTLLRIFRRDGSGFAAFEFAIIAPTLILLYFGVVDISNWYMAHRRLVFAASTMADLVTQSPGTVARSDITDKYWAAVAWIVPTDGIRLTIRGYRKNGSSAAPAPWGPVNAGDGSCGTELGDTQRQSLADNEMTDGNDIIIAEVCQTVEPIVLQVLGFTIEPLHYSISMRPRLGKTLDVN